MARPSVQLLALGFISCHLILVAHPPGSVRGAGAGPGVGLECSLWERCKQGCCSLLILSSELGPSGVSGANDLIYKAVIGLTSQGCKED